MTASTTQDLKQFFTDLKASGSTLPPGQVDDIKNVIDDIRVDLEAAVKPIIIEKTAKIPLVHKIVANAIISALNAELDSLSAQLENAV